ncbi:MAG: glycosyltransferase family 2 protein [Candidatus Thermoplasmatota archaeon]
MSAPFSLDESWFIGAGEPRAQAYRDAIAAFAARVGSFDTGATRAPPADVTVLVPTLDEEDYVLDAVRSLALQTLRRDHPEHVHIMLVDSGSTDATVARAGPFVDRVVIAPRGKLTALTSGVDSARGDIIVEADADGWYPPGWLARMVEPFTEEDVVAVRGVHVYHDSPALRPMWRARRTIFGAFGNFPGGVRAYRRSTFRMTGGFRLDVDQSRFWSLWREEEWRFRDRLASEGRLVDAREAMCFKSARRSDPFFVRDARVDTFRAHASQEGRFRDGITDSLYRARRRLAAALTLR